MKATIMTNSIIPLPKDITYYGTQYYRAPTPLPDVWEEDLRRAKAMGLGYIQLRMQWRWHERREGEFCFDDSDRLFELAADAGLSVVVKFMLETAPAWLFRKYCCQRIAPDGLPIVAGSHSAYYVGGWWPCFENPDVRCEAERFIQIVTQRYRKRENLLLFNAWNELNSSPVGDCACPSCRDRYRNWLKDSFKTIEALNGAYGKAWGKFSEIDPPARYEDYAELYLWRLFRAEEMSDRLRWVTQCIKAEDSVHPVMAHVSHVNGIGDILCATVDDRDLAGQVDFLGASLSMDGNGVRTSYPCWPFFCNDSMRSVSPYYWIHEVYTNNFNWDTPYTADDIRTHVWACLASGARGMTYWQFRAERLGSESNACGIIDVDGRDNDRSEEVSRIGAILEEIGSELATLSPGAAKVAIVYDLQSDIVSRLEETNQGNLNYNIYQPGIMDYRYKRSIQGIYQHFLEAGYMIDFVYSREIEKIADYQTVFLPYMIVMDDHKAHVLRDFVREGGSLISDASPGLRLENTWVSRTCPGHGLDEVFGAVETRRIVNASTTARLDFDDCHLAIQKNIIAELIPTTADVTARWSNGAPALTKNKFGRGQAILCGLCPGIAKYNEPDSEEVTEFIQFLLGLAGVLPDIELESSSGRVFPRWLQGTSGGILFLFNYRDTKQVCSVANFNPSCQTDLLMDKPVKAIKGGFLISIPPYGTVAIRVKKSTQPKNQGTVK